MDTLAQGNNMSEIAISNIASHGFWIYIRGRDHFMSYEDFPCFRDHSVEAIANVVECATGTKYPSLSSLTPT